MLCIVFSIFKFQLQSLHFWCIISYAKLRMTTFSSTNGEENYGKRKLFQIRGALKLGLEYNAPKMLVMCTVSRLFTLLLFTLRTPLCQFPQWGTEVGMCIWDPITPQWLSAVFTSTMTTNPAIQFQQNTNYHPEPHVGVSQFNWSVEVHTQKCTLSCLLLVGSAHESVRTFSQVWLWLYCLSWLGIHPCSPVLSSTLSYWEIP